MFLEHIGGRKFIGLIVLAGAGAWLVYTGNLDPLTYWGFMTANFGIYTWGNIENAKAFQANVPMGDVMDKAVELGREIQEQKQEIKEALNS